MGSRVIVVCFLYLRYAGFGLSDTILLSFRFCIAVKDWALCTKRVARYGIWNSSTVAEMDAGM